MKTSYLSQPVKSIRAPDQIGAKYCLIRNKNCLIQKKKDLLRVTEVVMILSRDHPKYHTKNALKLAIFSVKEQPEDDK